MIANCNILEYDGYDDVYGHSVEEDYCMSPSEAAFMYDREGSRNQRGIGVFLQTEKNIAEENEVEVKEVLLFLIFAQNFTNPNIKLVV